LNSNTSTKKRQPWKRTKIASSEKQPITPMAKTQSLRDKPSVIISPVVISRCFFPLGNAPEAHHSTCFKANFAPNGELFLKIAENLCQFKGYEKSGDSLKIYTRHHRYCKIEQSVSISLHLPRPKRRRQAVTIIGRRRLGVTGDNNYRSSHFQTLNQARYPTFLVMFRKVDQIDIPDRVKVGQDPY